MPESKAKDMDIQTIKAANDMLISNYNEINRKYQEEKASIILSIARNVAL